MPRILTSFNILTIPLRFTNDFRPLEYLWTVNFYGHSKKKYFIWKVMYYVLLTSITIRITHTYTSTFYSFYVVSALIIVCCLFHLLEKKQEQQQQQQHEMTKFHEQLVTSHCEATLTWLIYSAHAKYKNMFTFNMLTH